MERMMMKKGILFSMLAIGFVATNGLAIEEQTKPSIKKFIYLCDIHRYKKIRDKELSHKLDNALIFNLNVGEQVYELTTFKDASLETFDRMDDLGFIQCYDFPNNVPVIVTDTTLTKHVIVCDKVKEFYEAKQVYEKHLATDARIR